MNSLSRFAICLMMAASPILAGDWPQILGPHRSGVGEGERIVETLPARPKPLWTKPVGEGFAGVAVMGGTAVLFHRTGDVERVEALSSRTGKTVWKSDSPTAYAGSVSEDNGPRCVPMIAGDAVIVYGAEGRLRCLDLKTGKERWSNETHETFDPPDSYFGAGSTPLVEGGLVLVNVGGSQKGAGLVAFDLKTGKVRWKGTSEQPGYSSPVAVTVGGKRQAVFVTRYNCLGVETATGKVLWTFPFGSRGPTVNAASPVIIGDRLFVTSSYGVGAVFAKLSADGAEELWRDKKIMASQYTTPIEHEGALYGIDGRQDVGPQTLRCFDPASKRILWDQPEFGYATLIKADGKLLAQKTDGELVLVLPDKTAYRELSRSSLASGTTRALPALANGLYLLRDEGTLYCYDLSPQ